MRSIFFILISCWALEAHAQFPSEVWHEGTIYLLEGDTLQGLVKYDLETDIVQYSYNNLKTAKAYSPRKLTHLDIFDEISHEYRSFFALPYAVKGDYETPILFELLFQGRKMSLLARESIVYQVSNYRYGSTTAPRLVYQFYLADDQGKIRPFSGKKKDLLWLLNDRSAEINKFIKSNHLKVERRSDLIKIVAYYNSLFKKD